MKEAVSKGHPLSFIIMFLSFATLFVRPLHKAVLAPPNSPRFAPFGFAELAFGSVPGCLRTFTKSLLFLMKDIEKV